MIKETVTIDQVIEFLNELVALDGMAMVDLVYSRVSCNEEFANHPTCQVRRYDDGSYAVGVLGIVNGMFGTDDKGWGEIVAQINPDGDLLFRRARESDKKCQVTLAL